MQNNNHEWLKRCFNCMEPIDSPDAVCANCGWDNHNRENGNAALEQTILKDQYIVGKSLGRGGFGITYVGFDLALERRIAIKEFFPIGTAYRFGDAVTVRAYTETEADFQSGLKQALQESRTTAKLGHIPNVMQVHNVFLENGTVYMIMEYIEGISLGDEVKRNGKLNWREALHLLYPIMNALEKIHEKGLIHRDVSPENIIRRKETGEPVLLDFGSARPPKEGLTVMLKPGYAPAEQYSRNSEQDGRVDEYALCATLYYLVTGSAPASADLRMFAKKELKRPSELADNIPTEFEKVLLKGMELDSSNRYASMRELHEAFLKAEKEGTAERKGSVGNKAAVSSKGFKKSRNSEDYKDSNDAGRSGNSGNAAGSGNGKKPAGSGTRKPEKKEAPRESRKIAGAFVGGVAVACLAGFLLFGNAGRDKDAKKEAVESAVEGSVAEEEETVTATSKPTPTPEPTATNTPTPEPTATNTPTLEPTATNTPTPEPKAEEEAPAEEEKADDAAAGVTEADLPTAPDFDPNEDYDMWTVVEYIIEDIQEYLVCTVSAKEDLSEFYLECNLYGDDQMTRTTYDGKEYKIEEDKTGFMGGDTPAILDKAQEQNLWVYFNAPAAADDAAADDAAAPAGELPTEPEFDPNPDYDVYTVVEYTIEDIQAYLVCTVSAKEDMSEFYLECNFYGDDQMTRTTYDGKEYKIEEDKTGFMGGDTPAILDKAQEQNIWLPIE